MMDFVLPGFFQYMTLNASLIHLMTLYPLAFRNVRISAIYDAFPGQIWNGGRPMIGTTTEDTIISTVNYFNSMGIPCRFTYTNSLITEEDLNDEYCNWVTSTFNNGRNEILINSELLEDYIRANYNNYQFISSTTKCLHGEQFNKELKKDYKLVVLDYRLNKNFRFLETIEDKSKVEILVNESCNPECLYRKQHYDEISRAQKLNQYEGFICRNPNSGDIFFDSQRYPTFVKDYELDKYVSLGFNTFKIMGRGINELDVIESYVYYLVQPECRDFIRYKLIQSSLIEMTRY